MSDSTGSDSAPEPATTPWAGGGGEPFDGAEPPDTYVFEVEKGLWDQRFAWITGIVTGVAIVLEIILTASITSSIGLASAAQTVAKGDVINGTFVERFGAYLAVIALMLGVAIITFGGWLAALELRGRLSVAKPTTVTVAAPPGSKELAGFEPSVVLEAVGSMAEKLGRVRGTVAVFVAGIVLVVCALAVGVTLIAASAVSGDTAPSPSASSTTTPTPSPTPSSR
ncbi:hypothetical protein [Lacisediminihabitans profunda]|uniref:Uncharacterized protein n=1 Tax=Lacisediminihabitans profunda TaxID=2594790 RepID=A0A5C8UWS0_9MICO|nr:hypothetical protein [Lacisediminihabitans profunda]TXN32047.1 hypothetical protein FVP33_03750 [Lacisediminihabitans profunda]